MAVKKKDSAISKDVKRLLQLCLLDDDFMSVVFEKKELAELLLRVILDDNEIVVLSVKTQYNIKNLFGRSVRLDILAKDGTGKIFNVEVQRDDRYADPKRARLNSCLLDLNFSQKGKKQVDLPETYVIFITEHDVRGLGKPIYRYERMDADTHEPLNDGSHIIYVNGENRDDTPLGHLMADFACKEPDKFYYKELGEETRYYKYDEKGVRRMCKIMEDIGKEARQDERKQMALKMLADGKLSLEDIARYSGLTLAKVKALANKKTA